MADEEGRAPAHRVRRRDRRALVGDPRGRAAKPTPPCRECGYPLLSGEKVCPRCGAEVPGA